MAQNGFSFRQYWKRHHLAILGVMLTAVCALYAFLPYHFPLKPAASEKPTEPKNQKESDKFKNIINRQNSPPNSGLNKPQFNSAPKETSLVTPPPVQKTYSSQPSAQPPIASKPSVVKKEENKIIQVTSTVSYPRVIINISGSNNRLYIKQSSGKNQWGRASKMTSCNFNLNNLEA